MTYNLLNNNDLVSIIDSVFIISGIAFVAAIDRRRLSYGDPFRRLPAIGFAKPDSRFGYTKTWLTRLVVGKGVGSLEETGQALPARIECANSDVP